MRIFERAPGRTSLPPPRTHVSHATCDCLSLTPHITTHQVFFITGGSFFMMNMMIAVYIDSFNQSRMSGLLTSEQVFREQAAAPTASADAC